MNQNPTPSIQIVEELIEATGIENPRFAFCPYKLSMFDCMEPVFLECKNRGFVADLVPLTYQTLPDAEWHTELLDFDKLGYEPIGFSDFRERTYDFVVIHYPYDGNNNVTKLASYEFAGALSRYGKILYIPYHGNIGGRQWSRFFTHPGAVQSDFICLGSKADVDIFREVNPGYTGHIIQTECSPKTECTKLHSNDPIPEQYKTLHHPVTLICGTLWTFTHEPFGRMQLHTEKIIQELEAGNTVIYRPHPLVYEAIAVMRPEALQKYNEFLADVSDLCILDESPFLHQAIRVADKLIGDPSSVLNTWAGTGKPYEVMT